MDSDQEGPQMASPRPDVPTLAPAHPRRGSPEQVRTGATRRRWIQLSIAAIILGISWWLLMKTDAAATEQYNTLRGCWPPTVDFNDSGVITDGFWKQHAPGLGRGAIDTFFLLRMHHRIIAWAMTFLSLVGWSGSIFLRVFRGDASGKQAPVPGWDGYWSSFVLAAVGSLLLFFLFMGLRSPFSGDQDCITEGLSYVPLAGA